mgnify:CR=1 FL=1
MKRILLSLVLLCGMVSPSWAGTYGQFITFDMTSTYASAKIYHYSAGTTTLQNCWSDRAKTTTVAQPLVADSNGVATAFCDGIYKFRVDSSADVTLYTWDNVNVVDLPLTGEGANLASAAAVTFGTDGDYFHITGTTTITSFSGTQPSVILIFDGALTVTHSANIVLRNAVNKVTVANDILGFVNDGSGVWREIFRTGGGGTGILTTKGDVLSYSTEEVRVGVGADGTLLSAQASATPGVAYKTPTAGTGMTAITNAAGTITFDASDDVSLIGNCSFTATVATKALTIALKDKSGANPSATSPCLVGFRSATLTTGTYVVRSVTAALSVVLSSGSTLGFTAAQADKIYWGFLDNAGTVELFVTRKNSNADEATTQSTSAEGGAGAADSATVLYSTTARSNIAIHYGGYVAITTGAVAGEWDNAPTTLSNRVSSTSLPGTLTAGTAYTLNPYAASTSSGDQAHGLNGRPDFFACKLINLTSDANWDAGDEVDRSNVDNNGANTGWNIGSVSATTYRVSTATSLPYVIDKDGGGTLTVITAASWKLTCTPYKIN